MTKKQRKTLNNYRSRNCFTKCCMDCKHHLDYDKVKKDGFKNERCRKFDYSVIRYNVCDHFEYSECAKPLWKI